MADTGHLAESIDFEEVLMGHSLKNPANIRATVLYDFEPDERNEINVIRGQNVRIMHEENGWAFVRTESGKVGFIPLRYCGQPQVRRLGRTSSLRRTRSKSPQRHENWAKARNRSANELRRTRKLSGSCPGLSDSVTESDSDHRQGRAVSSCGGTADKSTNKSRYSLHCQTEAKLLKSIEKRLKGHSSVQLKEKIAALLSASDTNKSNATSNDKGVNCGRKDQSDSHDPSISDRPLKDTTGSSRMSVNTSMDSPTTNRSFQGPISPTSSTATDSDYGTSMESDTDSSFGSVQMKEWKSKMMVQKQLTEENSLAESVKDSKDSGIESLGRNSKILTDSVEKEARWKLEHSRVDEKICVSKSAADSKCNFQKVQNNADNVNCLSHRYTVKENVPSLCTTIRQLEALIKQSCFGEDEETSFTECLSEGYGSDSSDTGERCPKSTSNARTETNAASSKSTRVFEKSDKETLLVLFGFIATEENDLTVRQGEIVTMLNHEDYDWCFVRNQNGKEGFIPFSYAVSQEVYKEKMICKTKQQIGANRTLPSRGLHSGRRTEGRDVSQQTARMSETCHDLDESDFDVTELTTRTVVTHSHKALTASELSVRRGDTVYFNRHDYEESSVWVLVFSPNRGTRGYVPKVYLAYKMEDLV
ncbi:serine-rich adhesin for platelets-like isoform X2 [Ptychodera flava]